ncbi:MAG: anti-sigma factor [Acidimicrobiales bacterium]
MSNTTPDDADVRDLAGLYALNALDADHRARFEEQLAIDPELRDEVAGFAATAARLADVSAAEPPTWLRDRVMSAVSETRQETPVVRLADRRSNRARQRVLLAVAAAALIIVAALGGYSLADGRGGQEAQLAALLARPDTKVVPLTAVGSGAVGGQVVVAPGAGQVMLMSDDMPPTDDDRTYELWNVNKTGVHNAGLFRPDRDGKLRAALKVDLSTTSKFVVTEEPAGGSKKATTPALMEASVE